MIRSAGLALFCLVSVITAGACSPARGSQAPSPASSYATTLASAQRRADSGDYAGADRILADYALKAKNKADAHEISFWRALHMVDPANKTASMTEGIRALDIYLSTPGAVAYRPQALVLKRSAMTVQAMRQAVLATPRVVNNGRDTVFVTRDEDTAALRDQLAKANAELERIKKRLANPSR
ncbi:MAG: hypothetical protein WKF55_10070 [Gemmatimonadaceae bacterium]